MELTGLLSMLENVSYNKPQLSRQINELVGKEYNLIERLKRNGIGSPRMTITSSSAKIAALLSLDSNRNTCNIEIRRKGVIVRFRSILETYAWVIPYYMLSTFQNSDGSITMHAGAYFLKLHPDTSAKKFMLKLIETKTEATEAYNMHHAR